MSKNNLIIIVVAVILIGVIAVIATKSKQEEVTTTKNQATNSPTIKPMDDIKELKIDDIKVGEGPEVKSGDTVVIHYKGTLLDGTKFDSSYDRGKPFETQIGVGRVIQGWDEGVIGMKVGGKRRLTIPSDKAYGPQGAPPAIPPNSPLLFELELLSIK